MPTRCYRRTTQERRCASTCCVRSHRRRQRYVEESFKIWYAARSVTKSMSMALMVMRTQYTYHFFQFVDNYSTTLSASIARQHFVCSILRSTPISASNSLIDPVSITTISDYKTITSTRTPMLRESPAYGCLLHILPVPCFTPMLWPPHFSSIQVAHSGDHH